MTTQRKPLDKWIFSCSINLETTFLLAYIDYILEKAMAIHSSIFSGRIPWTEDPNRPLGLQSQTQLSETNSYWLHIDFSLVAQVVKNLPAMWETWVQSLGEEEPLEKGMATHSGILAWRIPWREEPGGLKSMESPRVGHGWATNTFTFSGIETTFLLVYIDYRLILNYSQSKSYNRFFPKYLPFQQKPSCQKFHKSQDKELKITLLTII